MEKKTGNQCQAETPLAPKEPMEARTSDPGEMSKPPARAHTATVNSFKPTTINDDEVTEPDETHWISVSLKDDHGLPVRDEQYRVKLPDGSILSGYTDGEGKALISGLPDDGSAQINFPRISGDEWNPV